MNRRWIEGLVLLVVAIVSGIAFAVTDWDLRAAAHFYDATNLDDPWAGRKAPLWDFFYHWAPVLTGLLAVAAIGTLVAGTIWPKLRVGRLYALYGILVIAMGPGLVVNAVFKDHWGRARPREIAEFGGNFAYSPPHLPGGTGRKSFPCGHCSVAFAYGSLYFLLARRRRAMAYAALAFALVMAALMGAGRMAAGGHFLSDVIWSGILTLSVAWGLYYFVLRIPQREDARGQERPPSFGERRWLTLAGLGAVGVLMLGGLLLAVPFDKEFTDELGASTEIAGPSTLEVHLQLSGDLEIGWEGLTDGLEGKAMGHFQGFGLPISKVVRELEITAEGDRVLYVVQPQGIFTELHGGVQLTLDPEQWERVVVNLKDGVLSYQNAGEPPFAVEVTE